MSDAELIGRLCGTVAELAGIVREQREIISQARLVYDNEAEDAALTELSKLEDSAGRRL